jgi:hypothetical protein
MKTARFVEAKIYLKNKETLPDYFGIQHLFMMDGVVNCQFFITITQRI